MQHVLGMWYYNWQEHPYDLHHNKWGNIPMMPPTWIQMWGGANDPGEVETSIWQSAWEFPSASLVAQLAKNPPGFDPWVGKIPWRRERLFTPVFWPGEFHRLYSPWSHIESEMTEWLSRGSSQRYGFGRSVHSIWRTLWGLPEGKLLIRPYL